MPKTLGQFWHVQLVLGGTGYGERLAQKAFLESRRCMTAQPLDASQCFRHNRILYTTDGFYPFIQKIRGLMTVVEPALQLAESGESAMNATYRWARCGLEVNGISYERPGEFRS
jgi:hypothetical protein